ncbi:MAG: glycosyltransferase family 9 protein [Elusimicrobia bacterium]|nr:glycosyltransferase family 9 protein [Elusimicrobiota bacterium]
MNWENPSVLQSLQDLRETLGLAGRDSRIVRWACAYSRCKKRILSGIRQFARGVSGKRSKDVRRLRVFFYLAGGMGDAACARRLVESYKTFLTEADFEVYAPVPRAVQTVFGDLAYVTAAPSGRVYWKNYDLVIFACLGVKFLYADKTRLAALAPAFMPVFEKALAAQKRLGSLWDDPFLTEPALGRWMLKNGGRRFDLMSFTGGMTLLQDASSRFSGCVPAREKYGLSGVSYVTFHDGTGHAPTGGSSRSWPVSHWTRFIHLFKERFPHIKLVQLGGTNDSVYLEADICLAGKTELTDLPDILNGALCHVDTESGLVHLAQFLDVKSVVLFGPSDVRFFGYAKNKNLAAGACGGCMWMTPDWMSRCPLGKEASPCMRAVTPEQVTEAVGDILNPLE